MTVLYTRIRDVDHVLATFGDSQTAMSALVEYRLRRPEGVFWVREDPVVFCEDRPLCYLVGYFTKKRFVRVASFAESHFACLYLRECRKSKPELCWALVDGLF